MAVKYSISAVSIANFIDKKSNENEDFICYNTGNSHYDSFVLCDGAGGAGVFSKEWAQYLGRHIPPNPAEFYNPNYKWFYNISEGFHNYIISNKDLSDLILNKKVYRDGSFTTLSVCWIDVHSDELFYSCVGDSYLFIFKKRREEYILEVISFIDQSIDIDENPNLLNWLVPSDVAFPFKSIDLDCEFIIIMASDSLAKWIILNLFLLDPGVVLETGMRTSYFESIKQEKYIKRSENIALGSGINSIENLLIYLREISISNSRFENSMKNLHNNGEMDIDDYSLIYIEGNVSK